jgi:hypothetical protein
MHPDIEAAAQAVETRYGPQLRACEALRDFALEIAQPWGGRALDRGGYRTVSIAALAGARRIAKLPRTALTTALTRGPERLPVCVDAPKV